jgi:hypothetical protein
MGENMGEQVTSIDIPLLKIGKEYATEGVF